MIERIKKWVNKYRNLGIESDTPTDVAYQVRTFNSLMLTSTGLCLLFMPLALFGYNNLVLTGIVAVVILILLPTFFFNSRQKYDTSIIYLVIIVTVIFSPVRIFFINNWGEQFIFLILIFIAFIFLERSRWRFLMVGFILFGFLLSTIIHAQIPEENIIYMSKLHKELYLFAALAILVGYLFNNYHKNVIEEEYKQKQLINELQLKNQQIQQLSNERERFNHIASHDLKSPLRNIVSFLGLANVKFNRQQYEMILEQLKYTKVASHQMNILVDDILSFSKISQHEIQLEVVDLNQLLREVTEELKVDITAQNGELHFSVFPKIIRSKAFTHCYKQNEYFSLKIN